MRPGQLARVRKAMADGRWHTIASLAARVGGSQTAISARIRDLRKPEFGGHTVTRCHWGNGLWKYRLTPKHPTS